MSEETDREHRKAVWAAVVVLRNRMNALEAKMDPAKPAGEAVYANLPVVAKGGRVVYGDRSGLCEWCRQPEVSDCPGEGNCDWCGRPCLGDG